MKKIYLVLMLSFFLPNAIDCAFASSNAPVQTKAEKRKAELAQRQVKSEEKKMQAKARRIEREAAELQKKKEKTKKPDIPPALLAPLQASPTLSSSLPAVQKPNVSESEKRTPAKPIASSVVQKLATKLIPVQERSQAIEQSQEVQPTAADPKPAPKNSLRIPIIILGGVAITTTTGILIWMIYQYHKKTRPLVSPSEVKR